MSDIFCVRIDVCGSVGCYTAKDQQALQRGDRVVCCTDRGLEVGQVLAQVASRGASGSLDGEVLRCCSAEDEQRWRVQQELRDEAVQICQQLLDQVGASATVLDAVIPFEGQYICFYLLGQLDERTTTVARDVGTRLNLNVLLRSAGDRGTAACAKGDCGDKSESASGGCGGCCAGGGQCR